jgi:hypothetical protein
MGCLLNHRNETLYQAAVFERNWGRAEQIALEMLEMMDHSNVWYFNLSLAQLSLGKNEASLATLKSIPSGKDDLQKWSVLSFLYAQFGQYELAESSFARIPSLY